MVSLGVGLIVQPPAAQASVDVGTASQDCNGLVTFNMSTVGVSLGYTLVAYAGRTPQELASAQYMMGKSTTPWPISMVLATVSGTWQSPWPGQDIYVGVVPSSFPWGSFALNLASTIPVPAPTNCTYDMSLSKTTTSAGPYSPGSTATYDLVPTNLQNAVPSGWSVTEVLPPGTTLVSMTGDPAWYTINGATATGLQALMNNGANAPPLHVTVQLDPGYSLPTMRNVAYISPPPGITETNPLGTPPPPNTDANTTPTNNDASVDIPVQVPTSIGDFVWLDTNRNGIQDAGEPGVAGVKVNLLNPDGTPARDGAGNPITTTTDANGHYAFTNLPTGTPYIVQFAPDPALKYTFSPQTQGTNRTVDSNPGPDGKASVTTPNAGPNSATSPADPTIDAGLIPPIDLALSKKIVGSGPFTPGSTVTFTLTPKNLGTGNALPGWSVVEVLPSGLTMTSMSGAGYSCSAMSCVAAAGLAAGATGPAITVTAKINAGVTATQHNVAYIVPAAGDVPETNPLGTPPTTTTNTDTTPTNNDAQADVVVTPLVSIGDFVWQDTNRNGVQDAGEPGVAGVKVNLLDASGNPVKDASGNPITTTTNASGFYSFTNLTPSTTYTVQFVAPAGQVFTTPLAGTDRTKDSNPGPTARHR
ncbi:SdrD B-like domain-containing protein [Psychromicrobium xiongbiense]|uniref:SdrD B-like domain-containing protein n=1 Tax=Psychromicrobium xiongbiense TaxID=3051184 RepID=UPI00255490DF|nr:SdrD B-like domain-containing protein [Psychromicrobium sp. YIM S02556]